MLVTVRGWLPFLTQLRLLLFGPKPHVPFSAVIAPLFFRETVAVFPFLLVIPRPNYSALSFVGGLATDIFPLPKTFGEQVRVGKFAFCLSSSTLR